MMKNFLVFTHFLLVIPYSFANAPTPQEISDKVQSTLAPQGVQAVYHFTNHRTDGTTSEYEVKFEIKDNSHSRGYFLSPAREKGREVLRLDDALWTFMPDISRTIRIADRDSFAGGDFSNADILRVDWGNQYTPALAKETDKQWILDLTAKSKEVTYSKMRLWIDKSNTQIIQQHFFDSQGTLIKICQYTDIKTFGNFTRPSFLLMTNVITKQKSELKIIDYKTGVDLPSDKFTVASLGK